MKCNIKELQEGILYYFLEANAHKNPYTDGDIKIYKAILKSLDYGNVVSAMLEFDSLEKNEVFFYRTVKNRFIGDQSNEILDKIITLSCNYPDNNSKKIIGTTILPKGFIMSDSVQHVIAEYEEFLNWSIEQGTAKAQKLMDDGNSIDGETDLFRLKMLKQNYDRQIKWLKEKYENS